MSGHRMGIPLLGLAATLALVVASCASLASAGRTWSVQTEQEIRQLEGRLREAALTGATAVLDDLLADD